MKKQLKQQTELMKFIREFEETHNCTMVYVTEFGSTLHGTDNENSDIDFKGIFIPNKTDVLLKRDIDHFKNKVDDTRKNTKDDIDIQFYSIYKWFNDIKKGETGALDILFSMFREDTIRLRDDIFVEFMKYNKNKFLCAKLESFVGYCITQSEKYGVKGSRYNELADFNEKLSAWVDVALNDKLDDGKGSWDSLETWVKGQNYKYIRFVMAPGSRGSGVHEDIPYIEVLGKKFPGSITCEYFYNKTHKMETSFGVRTKAASNGTDYKSLAHAVRVILEVDELLDTGFITFPLKEKEYCKAVKEGKIDVKEVAVFIDQKIDIVNDKRLTTNFPTELDSEFLDEIILDCLDQDEYQDQ